MTQGTRQQTPPAFVGMSLPRQDGPDKVTGRTRYAGDQVMMGMMYARLVLSPYAHARIVHIDTSAAQAMPGVVAVFTAATLGMAQADSLSRVQFPLAQQEVLWCGHPVAVVVGETEAFAEDGADAVEVTYEPLPAAIEPETAARPGSPPARIDQEVEAAGEGPLAGFPQATAVTAEEGSSNVKQFRPMTLGNIEEGLRQAEVVVEGTYRTHPVHQSYLEPQSVTVAPSPSGHHMVVWSSTQGLFSVRSAVARALAMPEQQIRVEPVPIGGGFGGKESLLEPLAAAVASRVRRPVRLVYTRQDELLAGNPAPQMVMTITLGAKRDGTLTAIQVRMLLDAGAYPNPLAALSG
ncbi:MAG TPA: molybdopterin cofactor-binding domain-containing protein, partial [Ktedonobacteraceae bacterium]|nr:molybdopterin cofactor-binding domain-containing protein [Ktedonobacteraceae bacterium]